jgi:hypothetical protein
MDWTNNTVAKSITTICILTLRKRQFTEAVVLLVYENAELDS